VATENRPLILVTNDDGIRSPGLLAAVRAVRDLGEVLVVAPRCQQTGAGRGLFTFGEGAVREEDIGLEGVTAFSVEGSPAHVVLCALLELAPRKPDLAISGINYGENPGTNVTCSGTIGAALEAAVGGIPALAVSLETAREYHRSHSNEVDFTAAAFFTRLFARRLLAVGLPSDVDVLKIDVPSDATPETPWRMTRISRQRYFHPLRGSRRGEIDYEVRVDLDTLEPDSDIFALAVERVVAVSPLSLDLTSRVDLDRLAELLR